ncbi:hypothetical protein NUU61_005158 [Penicillium alfredii]|uniref:rRNA-processing protein EFG1 n=1 Tax=Penicillium alfredii TaxID=1506179 RepID=A0A9W9F8Z4_9EURO|nr:uncharacterized protein NUU61_005158 [Penicillium alfredii]KAJ5095802.1 hypothetical protein NUU61_005158 [Penicillium alfredii]
MSNDTRNRRDPPKRKSRDGSEDAPRKKQHRKADSPDEIQFEDYGSDGDIKPTHNSKGKPARNENEYPSVNDLKRRIRDVKRLLNKKDLSADARVLQERALSGYEQDLVEETARRERSQMIKKYHFVRFLDRKTATKQLNRLLRREKEQNLDSKQQAHLAKKIRKARVNLNYTIYYPLTEKYISLYPKSQGKPSDNPIAKSEPEPEPGSRQEGKQSDAAKPPLWSTVAKCMEEGTLDLLREGKKNIDANGEVIPVSSAATVTSTEKKSTKKAGSKDHKDKHVAVEKRKKHGKPTSKEKARGREQTHKIPQPAEAEEESDGGFFE